MKLKGMGGKLKMGLERNEDLIVELVLPVRSDSAYYERLVKFPPEGVKYVANKQVGIMRNTIKRKGLMAVKRMIRFVARKGVLFSRPLYGKPDEGLGSVKHFAHCIPKNARLSGYNFIVDVEGAWQLAVGKMTRSVHDKIEKVLARDECLKVYAWTKRGYDEMIDIFPSLHEKIDILPPVAEVKDVEEVIRKVEGRGDDEGKKFKVLYVARDFELKGGEYACEVMDTLARIDSKVEAVAVSNIKGRKKRKMERKFRNVKFEMLMDREKLEKLYLEADVMVYPSPIDTFGFAIVEAMARATPTIAMKTLETKAVDEIISQGVDGVYFNKAEYVNRAIELLIELKKDKGMLRRMKVNCLEKTLEGKFSVKKRNEKLKEVFFKRDS